MLLGKFAIDLIATQESDLDLTQDQQDLMKGLWLVSRNLRLVRLFGEIYENMDSSSPIKKGGLLSKYLKGRR
jgi:hypothetical protein